MSNFSLMTDTTVPTKTIPHISSWSYIPGLILELPVNSDATLIQQIGIALNNIPELSQRIEDKDKLFVWNIEYGTPPLEFLVPLESHNVIIQGKWMALHAAATAYEQMPHNLDNGDDVFEPPCDRRKWHKSEVRLYYNPATKNYNINFIRLNGDSNSFYHTWAQLIVQLCKMNDVDIPNSHKRVVSMHYD